MKITEFDIAVTKGGRMAEEKKMKGFEMDLETEARLIELAANDERSQAAEVRHLINSEYERRRAHQRVRQGAVT
jgi:predicted DNA-binding protein